MDAGIFLDSPNSPTPACLHRQYWHE